MIQKRCEITAEEMNILPHPAMVNRSVLSAARNRGNIPTELLLTKYITAIVRTQFCSQSLRSTVRKSCPSLCNAHVGVYTLLFRTRLSPMTWTGWRELLILLVPEIFRAVIQVEFDFFHL
jgi:hypothetical protein